jgi:3-methyladenine DNA glycosylase AlkC
VAEKLKNLYCTPASVKALARVLKKFYPGFDKKRFVTLVLDDQFEAMELKTRMRHTTVCMHETLPKSYTKALNILKKAAPHVKGFEAMCLPDYVELYGLDDWDRSLEAMAVFTKYSSSEFAIRPFIIKDPKRAMAYMKKLAGDKDPKVRRFASEGCRPRLPWAMALPVFKKNPSPILPVLEKLKNDSSDSVRNSVANNLNDISKDNPDVVLKICQKWRGNSEKTDWIIKHACRTMLKAGDSRAMIIFGFGDPKRIGVERFKLQNNKPRIGDKVQFDFVLRLDTPKACKVRLEYAVYFTKAKNKISKKVFKISEKSYPPGEYAVTKKHSFADMSTRKHYPGAHQLAIIVNGVEKAKKSVTLAK